MSRPPRAPEPQILYEDDQFVAVDKPAHMLSAPGRGSAPCLPEWLRQRPNGRGAYRIVHRLDRDASGVILFARTLPAQRRLTAQFVHRQVDKVYLALVSGRVEQDGEIDVPLAYDRELHRVRVVKPGRGKSAVTHFKVVEHFPGNTLVECRPLTGRTHQIRAHMAFIGHPLTVDPDYGGGLALMLSQFKPRYKPSRGHDERPLIARLTLHAARIHFRHPRDEREMTLEAPLPKDFRATVNQLQRLA